MKLKFKHEWRSDQWCNRCETKLDAVVCTSLDPAQVKLSNQNPASLRQAVESRNEEIFYRQLFADPTEFYQAVRALRMFCDPVKSIEFLQALEKLEAMVERRPRG